MIATFGIAVFWLWLAVGLILLLLEVILPGVYLVWFGAAALATGLVIYLLAPIFNVFYLWQTQILLFIIFSIIAVGIAKYILKDSKSVDNRLLNHTLDTLIGQSFTITRAIENDRSTVVIGGTVWRIKGEDLHKGDKVKLIAYRQGFFEVKKLH